MTEIGYQLCLPLKAISDFLHLHLPPFIADCQAYPDPDHSLENLLRQQNWPGAQAVCQDEDLLLAAVRYYGYDLLMETFGDGQPEMPGYILNTIEEVKPGGPGVGWSDRAVHFLQATSAPEVVRSLLRVRLARDRAPLAPWYEALAPPFLRVIGLVA